MFKNNIWKILIGLLILIMLFMLLRVFILKTTFYTIKLEKSNDEIMEFDGTGIIADTYDKDFLSFVVNKILVNDLDDKGNVCLINPKYEGFWIYIGNDSDKKSLQYYQINVHPNGFLKSNDNNNIVNALIKNKDNIYFCFVTDYESTKESCLKASINKA